ncbi:FAD-dependent monooxygenase [Streptomyces sp. NPDC001941]|uniref:FAD-dependent monooxygenase n=1 Tax=Streptomyces sp. NPDC001941 TaxID=3154659 RepID=UPI0033210EC8
MSERSILISGASIAGPALASWLGASGWDVTVVERFPRLREEGQNIDVRGVGRDVLRRMGLEELVRSAHTGESGTEFVDERGGTIAYFPAGTSDSGGSTAELEVLRGQLSKVLHDQSSDRAAYVFGDQITALHDDGTGVDVEFAKGAGRRFDAVVLAEGLRSHTRSLVLPEAPVRELGLYIAYARIPRTAYDNSNWRIFTGDRGRTVSLRPDNLGTTQAFLSLVTDVRGLELVGRDGIVNVLRRTFGDLGWQTPRVLDALEDDALYFEAIGQAKLPTWSRGRVALLGDAAFCASPISGMSTTLALTGAYVLAGELTGGADPAAAFARYERLMRPFVTRAQKLMPGAPRLVHPRSRAERSLFRGVVRAMGTPLASRVAALASGPMPASPADTMTLPGYPMPSPGA